MCGKQSKEGKAHAGGRAVGKEERGAWPFGVRAHLLQKLDLILQELVHMLRLLLSLLKLSPELRFILAAEVLHISTKTSHSQSCNLASEPVNIVSQ